jgi:NADH-quinone oxidoreductase subunit L
VAERFKRTFALLSNKFYLDEIYDFLIVRPFIWFNSNVLYRGVDASIIDDVAVEGSARGTGLIGSLLPRLQTGFAPHYLFFMGVGLAAIIGWIVL